MKVMLVLEALDKASRTIRAMQRSMQGANDASRRGAQDAARAHERAAQSLGLVARAQTAAGRAAAAFASTSRRVAQVAEQAWQRVLVVVENYARRQAELARAGVGKIGAGARQVGQGVVAGGRVAAGVATGAGVLGTAGAVVANQLVKPAAEFEKFRAILKVIEGSAEKAGKALDWVANFAATTPYDIAGVTEAFVKMRSYGLQPMNGSLRTIGDAAAAMGKPLMQAVEAIADAVTGENERLKQFGITASKAGKYIQYAFTDVNGKQRTVKALASDRAAIEKAILGIWAGRFGGAMDEMSRTWDGMTANLGDAFTRIQLMIMNAGLFDWMKEKLAEILTTLDSMAKDGSLQEWAKRISTALQQAMTIGWEAAKGMGRALLTLAGAAERIATAIGGWENFAYLGLAVAFAQPIYYVAAGLYLMASGAFSAGLAIARLAILGGLSVGLIAVQSAAQLAWFALRGGIGATMLLGRALIFLSATAIRGAVLGVAGLVRGLLALPGAMLAAAAATGRFALALLALPGRLLASARGIAAMALAGLRALPGLLIGAARGVAVMAASGLAALPGLLMSVARGFVMFGASLMATPVGWFIAGVAAIAAAAYLIYDNWDSIGPWLSQQWEAVKTAFSDGWAALTSFDWSSLIPNFDWKSLLPSWSWLDIIPILALPSFDWKSLLPNWDWSSIIPSLPDFSSWFGGAAPAPAAAAHGSAAAAPAPVANPAQLAAQAADAQKQIAALQPAAQAAVAAASQVLASASFHSHGVALMETLAAGIRAGAGAAVGAVRDVAQQLRDHLPHSPAKTGPLSDLDKIKFSETLALGIRPGPAVAAASAVAAGMLAAVSSPIPAGPVVASPAPVSAGVPASPAPAGGGGGGAAGAISVHYAPTITIGGGGEEAAASFRKQLEEHADVLAKLVNEAVRRQQRKDY